MEVKMELIIGSLRTVGTNVGENRVISE